MSLLPRIITGSEVTKDHVVPRVKGGTNDRANIVWACALCNLLKSDMSYEEFRVRRVIRNAKLEDLEPSAWGKPTWHPDVKKFQSRWARFQSKIIIQTLNLAPYVYQENSA